MESELWSIAVVGGPILLGFAILWGFLQARRRDKEIDPVRSSSDPSLGMAGAGVSSGTAPGKSPRRGALMAIAALGLLAFVIGGVFAAKNLAGGPSEPTSGLPAAVSD